jgi:DnaK suppressor protein
MNKEILKQIEQKLLEEKSRVEKELERFLVKDGNTQDYATAFPDYGDREDESVSEIEDYSINLSLEQVLKNLLRDIVSTLEKLKSDKYGICRYCGNDIDPKRLMARPVSSSCIECKNKLKMG